MKHGEMIASDEKGSFGYKGQRRSIIERNTGEEESEPHGYLAKGILGSH